MSCDSHKSGFTSVASSEGTQIAVDHALSIHGPLHYNNKAYLWAPAQKPSFHVVLQIREALPGSDTQSNKRYLLIFHPDRSVGFLWFAFERFKRA